MKLSENLVGWKYYDVMSVWNNLNTRMEKNDVLAVSLILIVTTDIKERNRMKEEPREEDVAEDKSGHILCSFL